MKIPSFERPLRVIIVLGILFFLNIIFSLLNFSLDFSEEKRYSLSKGTIETLKKLNDEVHVRILLDGEFPSGFKRLRNATNDLLNQFKSINAYIGFEFENPNAGSIEVINEMREKLAKDGLTPVNLKVKSGTESSEQLIYPYAIFNLGERKIAVNLLEHQPELDQEANLNNSISQLEYKFINAVEKILRTEKQNILFTTSNGELASEYTRAAEQMLKPFYNVIHSSLDSLYSIKSSVDLVVIVKPISPFSERNKFILDQYLMQGGKIIWMIDALKIGIDSFTYRQELIPEPLDLNLSDLLFQYGVRIEPTLVLDMECSKIAQVIGKIGDKPQIELYPWYYFPVAATYSNHPIVNNIDRILLDFPAKIDTVKTASKVIKTPLIVSSPYSRYQLTPTKVGFDILRYPPDPNKFDKPHLTMGILLEGSFNSPFANKLEESMLAALKQLNLSYKPISEPTSMIVIADGEIIRNYYDANTDKHSQMGYSKFEKISYSGNKSFFMNSVEYLCNETNILEARSKEFKIRLLDQVKIEAQKTFWQFLNIGLPFLLLILGGYVYNHYRSKKFTQ
ncbi:MAG: gliding motility-associated ABC transporter substrate-binding protein GldG [Saprospiraceae bacterium]|nr:gliding motility-associated ABC transporter substrate-binding protein GldG [Saprospiraceae bacterium]